MINQTYINMLELNKAMDKKTIYDVAREAGVSISTVSRVINGSANVRESTRRKVEAACVNYRPVASARDLPAKRSKMIGVLINHRPEYFFLNDTYSNALLGISVAAKEAGYRLLLDICDTETEFDNLFYEQRVDGFVMMGVRKNSTLISLLKQHEVPFVLVGSYHEDESVYQVDINDQSAIFSVTNYLIGLGHKRIGIITSSPEYSSASDRVVGYCQAMREAWVADGEKRVDTVLRKPHGGQGGTAGQAHAVSSEPGQRHHRLQRLRCHGHLQGLQGLRTVHTQGPVRGGIRRHHAGVLHVPAADQRVAAQL